MSHDHQMARLTESGLERFKTLLERARATDMSRVAIDKERVKILKSKGSRRPISGAPKVDDSIVFETKLDLALHAIRCADAAGVPVDPDADENGFWAWMALLHFWQITEKKGAGVKIGQIEKYVPTENARRFYKHLVAGPAWMHSRYGDSAAMLLQPKPSIHSDRHEQLLGNKVTSRSVGVIDAANRLFYDPSTSTGMKTGSNPNNSRDLGLRYLVRRLMQLSCTYDIRSMNADDILAKFPELTSAFPDAG